MKTGWLGVFLAAGLMNSAVMASNINISVQGPNGEPVVIVASGGIVSYRVVAELSDNLNEGLALVGFSLHYTGGNIDQQGNTPNSAPMSNFVIPDGITNPAGFGGTLIGGDLIQCGGAQNTIKNTVGNAPFPIGAVITGIAWPGAPVVVLTGSFTKPPGLGDFQLVATAAEVFANVITDGQDGSGAFWATEAAGVGTITNLTVGDVPTGRNFVSSVPDYTEVGEQTAPSQGTLWRSAKNTLRLTFDGALTAAPTAGQIQINELLPVPPNAAPGFGPNLAANGFTFLLESGDTVLRIRDDDATSDLVHGKWYAIRNTGGWTAATNFEIHFPVQVGDANGDGRTLFSDLGFINAQVPSPAADDARRDVNGDANILFSDLGAANAKVPSDLIPKPTGH